MNEFYDFLSFLDERIDYYNSLAESLEMEKENWGIAYCIDEILTLEKIKDEAERDFNNIKGTTYYNAFSLYRGDS